MYFIEGGQRAVNEVYRAAERGSEINTCLINCQTNDGDTALMLAIQRTNLQVLRALIKAGADVNVSRSFDGRHTALSLAVDKGHTTAVRELLQRGAFLSCEKGMQALDMAKQFGFLDAVVKGEKFLIDKNQAETMDYKTGVYMAFTENRIDLLRELVKCGSYISLMHNSTYTCVCREKYLLQCLIDAGINVNIVFEKDKTALIKAMDYISVNCFLARANMSYRRNYIWASYTHETSLGREEIVKMLLDAGADVNAQTRDGQTAVHLAAEEGDIKSIKHLVAEDGDIKSIKHLVAEDGDIKSIKHLVAAGGSINVQDKNGDSVLFKAIEHKGLELAKYLLQKGADVDACSGNNVPILLRGVQLGDLELVQKILQFGGDVKKTDNDGRTCLHIAISEIKPHYMGHLKSSLKMLQLLLAHGPDVNHSDKNGRTALHYCVENEHFAFSNVLIQAGADVNLLNTNHDTPLLVACRWYLNNFKETDLCCTLEQWATCVHSLITPATRVNIADKDGYTALHLAAQTNYVQLVERLLGAGGDVRVAANTGETVLHCGARNDCSQIMDILLKVPQSLEVIDAKDTQSTEPPTKSCIVSSKTPVSKLKVYRFDRTERLTFRTLQLSGKTALMVAIENSKEQTALKLLSRGPDLNVHTDEGYTVLHFAALRSCTEVVRHLLQAGCNVNKQTEEGHTPLMLAGNKEIALMLCDAGADVNLVNQNGDKALQLAIFKSQADVAQLLINKGAVIDGAIPEALPPLVLAAALNEIAIVKLLLKAGANVNVLSSSGISPLMAAAACNPGGKKNFEIFQILHEHGADFNMTGKKGRTALMYLIKHGNLQDHLNTFLFFGADRDIEDQDNRSALTFYLLKDDNHFQIRLVKKLLKSGHNPLIDVKYRNLLMKHELKLCKTMTLSLLEFIPVGSSTIILEGSCQLLRMQVCNGVVLKHSYEIKYTDKTEKLTALMLSLQCGQLDVTKYLLAACYMTVSDLRQLRQLNQSTTRASNARLDPELRNVITAAVSEPWPLVKLAFITVSTMLGESPERDERLAQTNLPPKLKQLLMFQSPASFLPVSDWSKISLCFDPVVYETLPRPRPLLYNWPIGIDIVR